MRYNPSDLGSIQVIKGTKIIGAHSIEELCSKLKSPRKVMMLVKAGKPVDDFIAQIVPFLSKGKSFNDLGNLDINQVINI